MNQELTSQSETDHSLTPPFDGTIRLTPPDFLMKTGYWQYAPKSEWKAKNSTEKTTQE